jgi:hypothetical protein
MSMVRLSRWLWQGNVFVLIFDLVQHVAPLFCSSHWHNYFLQLGQAVRAQGYGPVFSLSFLDVYGSGPRPRTKRVKNDCTLSADYYNINSYIIIYYIIIKLLIMKNHPSQNWKWNSFFWEGKLRTEIVQDVTRGRDSWVRFCSKCPKYIDSNWFIMKLWIFVIFLCYKVVLWVEVITALDWGTVFAHKSVPHLSSQCALAHMAKTLSFHKYENRTKLQNLTVLALHVKDP